MHHARPLPAGISRRYKHAYQIVRLRATRHPYEMITRRGSSRSTARRTWRSRSGSGTRTPAGMGGNTLVVRNETNFNDKRLVSRRSGRRPHQGIPQSEALRVVERFPRSTRTPSLSGRHRGSPIYTGRGPSQFPLHRDPNYQIFEYAGHEGNRAVEQFSGPAGLRTSWTPNGARVIRDQQPPSPVDRWPRIH